MAIVNERTHSQLLQDKSQPHQCLTEADALSANAVLADRKNRFLKGVFSRKIVKLCHKGCPFLHQFNYDAL
ncbi:hypothetical protein BG31_04430 [Bacillus subtilis subsp. subtilis]|nr:hypothetical protein BCM26_17710 [Bacillus subtilis]OJH62012.1 hypothetical protein BOH71_17920 [Bacillus subtilis]OTQ89255.1 hypothetical protein BG31_04430 [Bacillus subtilis subsp. subtilis]